LLLVRRQERWATFRLLTQKPALEPQKKLLPKEICSQRNSFSIMVV